MSNCLVAGVRPATADLKAQCISFFLLAQILTARDSQPRWRREEPKESCQHRKGADLRRIKVVGQDPCDPDVLLLSHCNRMSNCFVAGVRPATAT